MKKLILLGCINLLMLSCNGNELHTKSEESIIDKDMNTRIIRLYEPNQNELDDCIKKYTEKGYKIKQICGIGTNSGRTLYIHIEKEVENEPKTN